MRLDSKLERRFRLLIMSVRSRLCSLLPFERREKLCAKVPLEMLTEEQTKDVEQFFGVFSSK